MHRVVVGGLYWFGILVICYAQLLSSVPLHIFIKNIYNIYKLKQVRMV